MIALARYPRIPCVDGTKVGSIVDVNELVGSGHEWQMLDDFEFRFIGTWHCPATLSQQRGTERWL